jgi:hypothetical protein
MTDRVNRALQTEQNATGEGQTLAQAPETYHLRREIPVEEGFDLVVAGGGPAGVAAALAAARLGARVLLVEAMGCLGGMGTSALVANWYALGEGKAFRVGGILLELIHALCREGWADPEARARFEAGRYVERLGYDPEGLKLLLDGLCDEAGIEVRFYTRVIDADADEERRQVRGVITHSVEGYRYIRAGAFVDATGNAVLSDLCGVRSREAGRDTPNIMPPTLCARIADVDDDRFDRAAQQTKVEQAIADGFFSQPDRHVPGLFPSTGTTATMNAGHLFHTDALETRSLSDAMVRGRELVQEYAAFYRAYVPGCERMKVVGTGALLGVRESRRIVGEYELNYEDFCARRHFPDQIAVYRKRVDIHVYDTSPEEYARYHEEFNELDVLRPGESYGIPYGVLVPKGWANLWVAGRPVSADLKVHGAIRDQPACILMGQAAGTAAVQAVRTGQPAYDLDTAMLVRTLREADAYLPQSETSRTMTRR